jgi:hypothetical protein
MLPRLSRDVDRANLRQFFAQQFRIDPKGALSWIKGEVLGARLAGEEGAELLLPYLVDASYAQENLVHPCIHEIATPPDILRAALTAYDHTADPRLLEVTAGLLTDCTTEAWPTLAGLAHSRRPECRYFVEGIAGLKGVCPKERRQALLDLAHNPDPATRWELLEVVDRLAPEDAPAVWRILAGAVETDIRAAAEERLAAVTG